MEDNNEYLNNLNPAQLEAVQATDGALLVLAGAGTGKTSVLTTRIAHILRTRKAFAGQVLAVTFTNKAAKEMVARVQNLLGYPDATRGMWLGTFHAIGARILRAHAEIMGLTSNFSILDSDDQIRLLKSIMEEAGMDVKTIPPKALMGQIQQWKDLGLTPEKVTGTHMTTMISSTALSLYKSYQARLKNLNACDFGDLLLHNLTIFQQHPAILQEYAQRFHYILVDEYQDTNVAQYLWLRLLAMGNHNICCVGDDDQSIYGWRGAEVGNILRFEKDYPNAQIVRLEQNYRSTPHILAAASAVIAQNSNRLGKTLWTQKPEGELIRIKSVWDGYEEARFVGEEIEYLQREKISLAQITILVRAGFQTRDFEERFLNLGIPYRVIGGLRFYERQEIRDAVAYLRLATQPRDDLAFERIINTPRRGIGKATLEQLHIHARAHNISLTESLHILLNNGELKGRARTSLGALAIQLTNWREIAKQLSPNELLEKLLEETGYIEMWKAEKTPEAQGRIENLRELIRALEEFPDVGAFLEHVGLVMDTEKAAGDDMVSIMTLHAAKGLEFDTVFLPGWEEGVFPHQRSLDEKAGGGLEEERRLAYVGITRARRLLYISYAANRRIYNQWQSSIPSRFLREIPEENIDILDSDVRFATAAGPALFQKGIDEIFSSSERYVPVKSY